MMTQAAEIEQIKSDIEKIIIYSQQLYNTPKFKINPLMDQWLTNKKKFIERFKKTKETTMNNDYSNFIYEFPDPIAFPLDEHTKISKINGFIDFLVDYLYEHDVDDFISSQFIQFLKLNKRSFFDNKVSSPFIFKHDVIPADMKLLKSFKFFFSGSMLEDIQNKASMILQENKIIGRLCISVHPLDYLSASETNYDWRSCHSLDGDYRSGNLAYMADDCTVMCYIRGEEKEKLPRFPKDVPWPSKKWRMLLFLNQEEEIAWAGRQYPFESNTILEKVGKEIVPIISGIPYYSPVNYWYGKTRNWDEWENNYVDTANEYTLSDKYVDICGFLFGKRTIIDGANDLFYNDLLYSTKYTPSYMVKHEVRTLNLTDRINHRSDIKPLHLKVGKDPICPCCGAHFVEFSDEMVCVNCDNDYGSQLNDEFIECASCGKRIYREDAHEDDDGDFYCDHCWEEW